jgi:hypothetical protein
MLSTEIYLGGDAARMGNPVENKTSTAAAQRFTRRETGLLLIVAIPNYLAMWSFFEATSTIISLPRFWHTAVALFAPIAILTLALVLLLSGRHVHARRYLAICGVLGLIGVVLNLNDLGHASLVWSIEAFGSAVLVITNVSSYFIKQVDSAPRKLTTGE